MPRWKKLSAIFGRTFWMAFWWATACSPALAGPPTAEPGLRLLPWPKSVRVGSGGTMITAESRILAANPELTSLAEIVRDELRLVTGLRLATGVGEPREGDVVLRLNPRLLAGEEILSVRQGKLVRTRDGAHRIEAGKFVTIEGFDRRAVAEGTSTLLQLTEATEKGAMVPAVTILDWPHADFTGVMLDVARQANSIDDIRRCIRVCRAHKVRYLQLHLTDDQAWTFPSKAYPKLGTMNGSAHGGPIPPRYDPAELRALVKYADERGVTLVPELGTPGHSSNACATMPDVFGYVDAATGRPVGQGAMNIANPKLYAALDTIIGEMCEVFASSPYFHIGFDEVTGLGNVAGTKEAAVFMREQGIANAGDLLGHFTRRVDEMVRKRGKKTIIWEGAANGVSKEIIHMAWDGNARTAERLIAQGIPVITVPWNLAGVPWQDWTMYHCNGSVMKKGDPVLGAMLPIWEQKGDVNFRWLRGGIAKRQERTWGPETPVDPENFAMRTRSTDRALDRLLYGFAIRHEPTCEEGLSHREITTPTTLVLDTKPGLGTIRLTTDGSMPSANSPVHSGPLVISDNTTVTARLFDQAGVPVGPAWAQPYRFSPLTLKPEGLLPNSLWFAETARLTIASAVKTGVIRFTLDGSEPVPASPAFQKPLTLDRSTVVRARWFDETNTARGNPVTANYQKLAKVSHAAVNKPVSIVVTAKLDDPKAAAKLLGDGILGRDGDWGTPEVLRLGDSDLEAVFDLGEKTEIRKVVGRFFRHPEAGVYPASRVEVAVSDDGKTFKPAGTTRFTVPQEQGPGGVSVTEIAVDTNASGRFVRVFCKNNGQLPAWHKAPGVPGHLMMDEIMVNPVGVKK